MSAGTGRGASRLQLAERFQEAIDAAAMRAGLFGTDEYLSQWRRVTRSCGGDLAVEVAAEAARLEAEYTDERLERLVRSGGEEGSALPQVEDPPSGSSTATIPEGGRSRRRGGTMGR